MHFTPNCLLNTARSFTLCRQFLQLAFAAIASQPAFCGADFRFSRFRRLSIRSFDNASHFPAPIAGRHGFLRFLQADTPYFAGYSSGYCASDLLRLRRRLIAASQPRQPDITFLQPRRQVLLSFIA